MSDDTNARPIAPDLGLPEDEDLTSTDRKPSEFFSAPEGAKKEEGARGKDYLDGFLALAAEHAGEGARRAASCTSRSSPRCATSTTRKSR